MLRQAGQKKFNNTNMVVIVNSVVIFLKYSHQKSVKNSEKCSTHWAQNDNKFVEIVPQVLGTTCCVQCVWVPTVGMNNVLLLLLPCFIQTSANKLSIVIFTGYTAYIQIRLTRNGSDSMGGDCIKFHVMIFFVCAGTTYQREP